jgi:hypothetical protein
MVSFDKDPQAGTCRGVRDSGERRQEATSTGLKLPSNLLEAQQQRVAGLVCRRLRRDPRVGSAVQPGSSLTIVYDGEAIAVHISASIASGKASLVRLAISEWWDGQRFTTKDWTELLANAIIKDLTSGVYRGGHRCNPGADSLSERA